MSYLDEDGSEDADAATVAQHGTDDERAHGFGSGAHHATQQRRRHHGAIDAPDTHHSLQERAERALHVMVTSATCVRREQTVSNGLYRYKQKL